MKYRLEYGYRKNTLSYDMRVETKIIDILEDSAVSRDIIAYDAILELNERYNDYCYFDFNRIKTFYKFTKIK